MAGGQGNGTAVLVGTDKTAPFLGSFRILFFVTTFNFDYDDLWP
jgi:hypothetical protein